MMFDFNVRNTDSKTVIARTEMCYVYQMLAAITVITLHTGKNADWLQKDNYIGKGNYRCIDL